ncbi:MAG: hypothetical protein JWR63_1248 [Conexibacter sp.]|jgi:hypothetical protein|nr:hypothetical protein [Conexibacter sp.]
MAAMLGKPSRRARKNLEANGRTAPATVLEISDRGMSITNGNDAIVANTEVLLKTRLRVEPAGEPSFEVEKRLRFAQLAIPGVGSTVTVRYDPGDHDSLMIDVSTAGVMEAMSARTGLDLGGLMSTIRETKAEHPGDRMAMGDALRAQLGQQNGVVFATPAPAAPDPIGQIERLAALHASGALTDAEFAEQKARVLAEG